MPSKSQTKYRKLYIKDTDVLKNKLNISNSNIIHELERALLEDAYKIFYNELNEKTVFDEKYFKQLHARTFKSLYDWAGKYRDFNLTKGDSIFCPESFIKKSIKEVFEELKKYEYLKDLTKKKFAKKLAYFKCDLLAIHPFCELNGRITRLFFDMIAAYNGYLFIDYSTVTPGEYKEASLECILFADYEKMEDIIFNGLHQ